MEDRHGRDDPTGSAGSAEVRLRSAIERLEHVLEGGRELLDDVPDLRQAGWAEHRELARLAEEGIGLGFAPAELDSLELRARLLWDRWTLTLGHLAEAFQVLQQAVVLEERQQLAQAERLTTAVLAEFPSHKSARGLADLQRERHRAAPTTPLAVAVSTSPRSQPSRPPSSEASAEQPSAARGRLAWAWVAGAVLLAAAGWAGWRLLGRGQPIDSPAESSLAAAPAAALEPSPPPPADEPPASPAVIDSASGEAQLAELKRLEEEVRAGAARALDELGQARREAERAGARERVGARFAAAERKDGEARALYTSGRLAAATVALVEAKSLFEAATEEARALSTVAEGTPALAVAPPATEVAEAVPPVSTPAASTAPSPREPARREPAVTAPPTTAAPEPAAVAKETAPTASPPPVNTAADGPRIEALLQGYEAAIEARDLAALKALWPSLSGTQEGILRDSFRFARQWEVDLTVIDTTIDADRATVRCARQDRLTSADGQKVKTNAQVTFHLSRGNGRWTISRLE